MTTWAASPTTQEPFPTSPAPTPPTFSAQTLRQIVHTSIGGSQVRVRLSNTFGTGPLVVGATHIGLSASAAAVVAGSDQALTFGGLPRVTVAPGAVALSDPLDFAVPALGDLTISIYLPDSTAGTTLHAIAEQDGYLLDGNRTGATNPGVNSVLASSYFLTGVEVAAATSTLGIVTLGDSITDGYGSTADANRRWPNLLAQRLFDRTGTHTGAAVTDQGIAGNGLLGNLVGSDALARFDRDVLAQPGVTDVIVLEGINDIGVPVVLPSYLAVGSAEIIAAYRQLIARAHDAGLRIYGATLTPFANCVYYSPAGETTRNACNRFIRQSGEFDGVIDFEAALRDGSTPPQLQSQYDCGDHLHPNDAGYQAMANTIPLRFFNH